MIRWAPHSYIRHGLEQGYSREHLEACLGAAHLTQDRGLPAILSLRHLAFHTGIPYWKVRAYVARKQVFTSDEPRLEYSRKYNPYRTFRITKKAGGYRRISVPEPDLIVLQKWIDKNILSQLDSSPYSYAFDGKPIVECAAQHTGCKWLIKIDLKNFFESLTEKQAYKVYLEAGYQPLVAFELARICTKARSKKPHTPQRWRNDSFRSISAYNCNIIGHLPQGAPTSPRLSNLIVRDLDQEITNLAEHYGLRYTRYADDMAFSTDDMYFSRGRCKRFVGKIYKLLSKFGLSPNPQKVKISPPRSRKVVLGLLVDTDEVKLSKDYRSSLECHWYYCVKDPIQHARERGFHSLFGLKNFIEGKIAYARQIDPRYVDKIENKLGPISWPV